MNNQPTHQASPPSEQWRPVIGYEGLYEVSDQGRVRSLDRYVLAVGRTGGWRQYRGMLLKQHYSPGSHGYLMVTLCRGDTRPKPVHKLVTEAFLGPRPPGQQVRHGPGGIRDNRLVNLCYGTRKENEADKIRDGTFRQGHLYGEEHPSSKLTRQIVEQCRRRYAAGERQTVLAREFGVTQQAMHNAIRGKTWR